MIAHKEEKSIFFNKLKKYNNYFYVALHFASPCYRETISALIIFVQDLQLLSKRISEPTLVAMRLLWWREQFSSGNIADNAPPELKILHGCDMNIIFDLLEKEPSLETRHYLWGEIFKLIARICHQSDNEKNVFEWGVCFSQSLEKTVEISQLPKLAFTIRFLKIPILLNLYSTQKIKLFLHMIKALIF